MNDTSALALSGRQAGLFQAWPEGRPIAQWQRVEARRSDDLAVVS